MIDLEKTRRRSRLWLPVLPWRKVFIWSRWEPTDIAIEHNEDEDPGKLLLLYIKNVVEAVNHRYHPWH